MSWFLANIFYNMLVYLVLDNTGIMKFNYFLFSHPDSSRTATLTLYFLKLSHNLAVTCASDCI